MVIVGRYFARHCLVNWSRQLEALIVREQLSSFDSCHYFILPIIQIVNKLITNDETRDDNNDRRVTTNQQRLKPRLEYTFVTTSILLHTTAYQE